MSLMILNYLWCRIEQVHLLSALAFDANECLAHAELVDVSSLPQFVFLQLLLKLCNIQVTTFLKCLICFENIIIATPYRQGVLRHTYIKDKPENP